MKWVLILLLFNSCRENSYTIITKSQQGYRIHDPAFSCDSLFKTFRSIESYYQSKGWELGYPIGHDRYTIKKNRY